jgi:hypothetical protein
MAKPENIITAMVKAELRSHEVFCWKHWQGPFSKQGVSDILGITPDGRLVAVECKTDQGRLSEPQQDFLQRIREYNGIAFVARSREDVTREMAKHGISRTQKRLF